MAAGAVKLVAATVESLYVSSRPGAISLTVGTALLAIAMGVGVALLSALVARMGSIARRAGGSDGARAGANMRPACTAGAICRSPRCWRLAPGSRRVRARRRKAGVRLSRALLLIIASALAIPALVSGLATMTAGLIRRVFGVEALLATRSLAGSLRRTSVLVGALATAIAMLAAVGIMVGSFRETVLVWMDDLLQADLYLRPAVPAGADRHPTMSAEIPALLGEASRSRRGGSVARLRNQLPGTARDARRHGRAHRWSRAQTTVSFRSRPATVFRA